MYRTRQQFPSFMGVYIPPCSNVEGSINICISNVATVYTTEVLAVSNANMKASKVLVRRIRQDLMSKTSDAEKAAIRNCERLGYKVVRQQPILTGRKMYFADIYLPDLKTIVEIDGEYHYTKCQKRKDNNRSAGIWRMGYHVVRLSNHDARDINKVKAKIELIKRRFA